MLRRLHGLHQRRESFLRGWIRCLLLRFFVPPPFTRGLYFYRLSVGPRMYPWCPLFPQYFQYAVWIFSRVLSLAVHASWQKDELIRFGVKSQTLKVRVKVFKRTEAYRAQCYASSRYNRLIVFGFIFVSGLQPVFFSRVMQTLRMLVWFLECLADRDTTQYSLLVLLCHLVVNWSVLKSRRTLAVGALVRLHWIQVNRKWRHGMTSRPVRASACPNARRWSSTPSSYFWQRSPFRCAWLPTQSSTSGLNTCFVSLSFSFHCLYFHFYRWPVYELI